MGVEILGDLRNWGSWPQPGASVCFTAVQALGNCLVSLGPDEMLAEQRIRLSLRKNIFFFRSW